MSLFIDTETTGLNPKDDELLEIAIIDDYKNILLSTLVRPKNKTSWREAEGINGISFDMVKNAPTSDQLAPLIQDIVRGNTLVAYNMAFDMGFLKPLLGDLHHGIHFFAQCAMKKTAVYNGIWDMKRGDYKNISLKEATAWIGYKWPGNQHRAINDADACRAVWHFLNKQEPMQPASPHLDF